MSASFIYQKPTVPNPPPPLHSPQVALYAAGAVAAAGLAAAFRELHRWTGRSRAAPRVMSAAAVGYDGARHIAVAAPEKSIDVFVIVVWRW